MLSSTRALFITLASIPFVVAAPAAHAQPANRPAAFQSAIATTLNQAPGWSLWEASLENDSGQWIFEVQVVPANGASILQYELDATTFAVLDSEIKSISSSKVAQIQAALAAFGSATITYQQAFAVAVDRTPFGMQITQVEIGIESGAPAYKFDFSDGVSSSRVTVNAATGAPSGTGGNPTPPGSGDITLEQAIAVALGAYPGAKILETEFEASDQRWEIKLITAAGVARKLRIASVGGAILSDDPVHRSREDSCDDRLKTVGLASANITLAQAKELALIAAGDGVAIKAEWEFEHGVLVAKVVVQDAAGLRTILISAVNGSVVTPTAPTTPGAEPAPVVDVGAAVAAAVNANPGSTAIEVEMELEGGRQFYKVKTLSLATPLRLRAVIVDGKTGVVWSNTLMPMATAYLPTARQIVALLPTATKTFADARTIALSTLGDGVVDSIEMEPEQGTYLKYNVDVIVASKTFRLVVDSRTGAVRPK